jgi:hypothetical protein
MAEMLTFKDSKSFAYQVERNGAELFPDENFSREIMQRELHFVACTDRVKFCLPHIPSFHFRPLFIQSFLSVFIC